MSRARELLDRVGTSDAVSWPAFWVSLGANAVSVFASGADVAATPWQRLIVLVCTQGVTFGALLLFRQFVLLRAHRPLPWLTLGAFALAGAARGAMASGLYVWWGELPPSGVPLRVVSGAVAALLLLTPVALAVSTLRRYRATRAALLQRQAQWGAIRDRTVERIVEQDVALETMLLNEVASALVEAPPAEQALELERLTADVVRPLSHDLAQAATAWDPPESATASVRVADVLERVASGAPLLPLMSAGAVALFNGAYMFTFGVQRALAFIVLTTVIGGILLRLANVVLALMLRAQPVIARLLIVVSALGLAGLLTGAMVQAVAFRGISGPPLPLSTALFFLVYGVPFALARALDRELSENVAQLQQVDKEFARSVARLRMQEWVTQRGTARALHGPVQSILSVAVDRLRGEGAIDAESLLGDLRAALDPTRSSSVTWDEAMVQIQIAWEGVCVVSVEVDHAASAALARDHICAQIAIEIASEAVSNAVRHGRASAVAIMAAMEAGGVTLEVRDNGMGAPTLGSGLGTRVLEDCAVDWDRQAGADGTILRASLPSG